MGYAQTDSSALGINIVAIYLELESLENPGTLPIPIYQFSCLRLGKKTARGFALRSLSFERLRLRCQI